MSRLKSWIRKYGETVWIAFLIVLLILATVLLVMRFASLISENNTADGPTDARFGMADSPYDSRIITDDKTGVEYLLVEHDGSIAVTVLYNVDGLPVCVDDINHGDITGALQDVHRNLEEAE